VIGVGPFISRVPKNPVANLQWRRKVRRIADRDAGARRALYDGCMCDLLFFLNFAGWCYEPRAVQKIKPFVTWPHQDPVALAMDEAIDVAQERFDTTQEPLDVLLEKSRAQGGTYLYLNIFLRRWLRDPMFSAGLVTRNEDLVDSLRDADTILWKFDWALRMLPEWLIPRGFDWRTHRSLTDHSRVNPETGALVVGYSANQDVGRGGRKTVFACDEIGAKDFIKGGKDRAVLEALHDVANCLFLVSTFGADSGVFFEACQEEAGDGVHLVLDWRDNPIQNRLAYTMRDGQPVAKRAAEQEAVTKYVQANRERIKRLEVRGYKVEGHERSPWYDSRCLRKTATPRLIAQELDRNPRGAVGKVFDLRVLDRMKAEHCRPPVWRGKIVFDEETLEVKGLIRQDNGPLELWFEPSLERKAPQGLYALACDIAAGGVSNYASNSVACGVDRLTGAQVLQYTVMGLLGAKFARIVVGLARWLSNAYLGWEDSGIASPFGREVVEVLQYGNIYYRPEKTLGRWKKTAKPGWWPGSDDEKGVLLESLCIAMDDGKFIPRSEELVVECGEYEWENGKIVHRASSQTLSASEGRAHGDRCIAAGVAWLLMDDRPVGVVEQEAKETPKAEVGSWAWCDEQEAKERRLWSDDEPQFELGDLLRIA